MSDFNDRIVLAKISKCKFHREAYPGETLTYRVKIDNQEGLGAMVLGTSHIGDELQCEIELMFASLDDERFENVELFEPAQFCRMIRTLRLFEVGVDTEGNPVKVPAHMIAAEKALLKLG
jgi:3-hydroxyacyl-[acyl-carrier-protein] dehydratase